MEDALLAGNADKLQDCYNMIEYDYYLLGSSAIEDQLQDNVPKAINDFIKIGIKVWVLTGDKPDTALSVAFACNLITHEYVIIELIDKNSTDLNQIVTESLLKLESY